MTKCFIIHSDISSAVLKIIIGIQKLITMSTILYLHSASSLLGLEVVLGSLLG